MVTIRVKDWTKKELDSIRESESHSSHDSVIKSLLKDRELAQAIGEKTQDSADSSEPKTIPGGEKPFENLTVLSELDELDDGVVFLWCPKCAKEIVHIGFEDAISMSVFEVECQQCMSWLDQDVIVAIEIGYPIETRLVEEAVSDDLKRCVIDYWDRSLDHADDNRFDTESDIVSLLQKYTEYLNEFRWDWPAEVPVLNITAGHTYRNSATDEYFDVVETIPETDTEFDSYRVRRYTDEGSKGAEEILEAPELVNLLASRNLYLQQANSTDSNILGTRQNGDC